MITGYWVLSPLDSNALKIAKKHVYRFINLAAKADNDFNFNKITFSAGACYGNCPVLKIEIDNLGNCYMLGNKDTEPYIGNFKGKLTTEQLLRLTYLLKHSRIKQMYTWRQTVQVMDTPAYSFSIKSNYKALNFSTEWPPLNIKDLIRFLTESYKQVDLVKDYTEHKFDFD